MHDRLTEYETNLIPLSPPRKKVTTPSQDTQKNGPKLNKMEPENTVLQDACHEEKSATIFYANICRAQKSSEVKENRDSIQ